ncbi:MAG: phosphotransferase [Aliidiomarina sp.]|uniref:phosphotransferase n=1 Tax=Aliidiomarina sp. TaxID=1872439 RepID=UPI0025BBE801|nr:phosphotransferase [Aliidiomarina sp.]MCH8500894.1 phosphotransferase [Aliidiomarina sp.]
MAFPTSCLAHLPVHGVWKTHAIGHDLANSTWRIENGEHQYIVKQYSHDTEFGRQSGEAIQLDQLLAEQGSAPQVIYADQDAGVVVQEFLNGDSVANIFDPIQRAEQLAEAQLHVHQLQVDARPWSLSERVQAYCNALEDLLPGRGRDARSDCESYADLFAAWEHGPKVFCHHDLNAEHVFFRPELKIIDWEYAGYGHPAFDVASTMVINDLYDDEIDAFLEVYNQTAEYMLDREELRDWVRLVALINRIWFQLQEALTATESV